MAVKIGIIADTATDTDMGKVFAEKNGYEAICKPVKKTVPA